jgi:hypothetical protein
MKPRRDKGRMGPFVPLLKDTIGTDAWRATSHGARSLYVSLKAHYNRNLGNAVYISSRDAANELGSNRSYVLRWFRELQYYGFIDMVSHGHLGVEGRGKAPHWRLTEEPYLGQSPTREFLCWDGTRFHEQKSPAHYKTKKQNPGPRTGATVGPVLVPEVGVKVVPPTLPSGSSTGAIAELRPGTSSGPITSLTTPSLEKAVGRSADLATEDPLKDPWFRRRG